MWRTLEKGRHERLKKKRMKPSACRAARALQGFGGAAKDTNFGAVNRNCENKERRR